MKKSLSEITVVLLFISFLIFAFGFRIANAQGYWVWVGDTVTGAYGEAVIGTGDAIYIARGKSFYCYRSSDNSFVNLADPPAPDGSAFKTGTALAWDFGDYIYALYGAATGDSRRYFYRYSISQNIWERLAGTPFDQGEGDAMTYVGRTGVYATVGGEQRPTYLLFYDPSTNSWGPQFPASMPGMGDGASMVWTGSDCLYILRGEYLEEEPLYDFWQYNITGQALASLADIPAYPHDGGVGGVGDGGSLLYVGFWLSNQTDYIYALSGNQAYPESIPDNRFYQYVISNNSWTLLADLPFGVGYYVGNRLGYADGHIYAWQGTPSTWEGGGDDLARYEFPAPTKVEVPLFKVLSKEVEGFEGGLNVTLTFYNYGCNATTGNVWLPWDRVFCSVSFNGEPPTGILNESLLTFDVNGDGDSTDSFTVQFIDNETVAIDGVTAKALMAPEGRVYYDSVGLYDVMEMNSFQLGLKNHTLYRVNYRTDIGAGAAGFGLDSFFRYHPGPNMLFIIEDVGASINSTSRAQITDVEINGIPSLLDFNWTGSWPDPVIEGQWYVDSAYVYPTGFIGSNTTFTVHLSIKGEVGTYLLMTIINWSPDSIHRYRYLVIDAVEIPFTINGAVHRAITYEDEEFPIDIVTNSTISENIILNVTAKEICFNATGYNGLTYFWNITIPQKLLSDNPWTITIDGQLIPYIAITNQMHTFLYFQYTYNEPYFRTKTISIKGTQVVQEFPHTVLPIFLLTTLITIILLKKKNLKQIQAKFSIFIR